MIRRSRGDRDLFDQPTVAGDRNHTVTNLEPGNALAHCLEPACFITASLYIIDYEQGGFMFARAGHCPTLYYHAMREEVTYFTSKGLGLGILRDSGNALRGRAAGNAATRPSRSATQSPDTGHNSQRGDERVHTVAPRSIRPCV